MHLTLTDPKKSTNDRFQIHRWINRTLSGATRFIIGDADVATAAAPSAA